MFGSVHMSICLHVCTLLFDLTFGMRVDLDPDKLVLNVKVVGQRLSSNGDKLCLHVKFCVVFVFA